MLQKKELWIARVDDDFLSEPPDCNETQVSVSGSNWSVKGSYVFKVSGYKKGDGFTTVSQRVYGNETAHRVGGTPYTITVPFEKAASQADAIHQAAEQLKLIATEFLNQANEILNPKNSAAGPASPESGPVGAK